ncbi:unnamed protein product [Pleuronectes platessa]|uniref:Uncharacterized protein n=1 Tax=Pleuronectes platessa TaxID=8262 RepID=A0A9N7TV55_PLEPL|nr:unnamed protein product [Pleuronectes platessa]
MHYFFGILVAQLWQTGVYHPSAIIPCGMGPAAGSAQVQEQEEAWHMGAFWLELHAASIKLKKSPQPNTASHSPPGAGYDDRIVCCYMGTKRQSSSDEGDKHFVETVLSVRLAVSSLRGSLEEAAEVGRPTATSSSGPALVKALRLFHPAAMQRCGADGVRKWTPCVFATVSNSSLYTDALMRLHSAN